MSKEVSLRWFEQIWNQRDCSNLQELITPGVQGHLEGGAEFCGVEHFLEFRSGLLAAIPDFRIEVLHCIHEGALACVLWRATGTHTGAGMGFAATHQTLDFRGSSWHRFEDGKIAEAWDTWNEGALMQKLVGGPAPALGALPVPEE